MRVRSPLAVALLACMIVLPACATPTPAETPSASAEPSRTPEPSLTPGPSLSPEPSNEPVEALSCDSILSQDALAAAHVAMGEARENGDSEASATLGGLSCLWLWPLLQVGVYPEGIVPQELSARYAQPVCGWWGYDVSSCYAAGSANGFWYIVALAGDEPGEEPAVAAIDRAVILADAVAERIEVAPPAPAPPRTADWWSDISCAALSERVEWGWDVNTDLPQPGTPLEGGWTPVRTVLEGNDALTPCEWFGERRGARALLIANFVPGGGVVWNREAGDPVSVEGAVEARSLDGGRILIASDGENLIHLNGSNSNPEDPATIAADAAAILRALASG